MTHSYPLHVELLAPCWCCRARQPFHFTSPTDQVVCSYCVRHLGSEKAELRDQQHVGMWVELFHQAEESQEQFASESRKTIADHEATIAALTAQVDELTGVVAGTFERTQTGAVRGLIESEVVKRAERNTELANRRSDWLMAAIWRVDALHREDDTRPQHCVCGKSIMKCAEWKAIEPVRQKMRDWETKNVRLRREGKRHGLPDDHPEAAASPA